MKFRQVEFDHLAEGKVFHDFCGDRNNFSVLDGRVAYRNLITQWDWCPDPDFIIGNDAYNKSMAELWRQANSWPKQSVPSGYVSFSDVVCAGDAGLVLDPQSGSFFVGSHINWGVGAVEWMFDGSLKPYLVSHTTDTLELDFGELNRDDEATIVLCSPGQTVYGHWIIDFVPRFFLLGLMSPALTENVRVLLPETTSWMEEFVNAFQIRQNFKTITYDGRPTAFRSLLMPSATKSGFRFAKPVNALAWKMLRDHYKIKNGQKPSSDADRIYVTRRGWPWRRLADWARLETMAEARGYKVVCPETLSISEQARLFSGARIIIGEDGSGLHNVIFSEPGARLGAIMPTGRVNLWHAGICQALGHKLSYAEAKIIDGQEHVVDDDLNALIDRLEREA